MEFDIQLEIECVQSVVRVAYNKGVAFLSISLIERRGRIKQTSFKAYVGGLQE